MNNADRIADAAEQHGYDVHRMSTGSAFIVHPTAPESHRSLHVHPTGERGARVQCYDAAGSTRRITQGLASLMLAHGSL